MNKELEYRGYRFNIKVEESHTGQFELVINDMGPTNYYQKFSDLSPDKVMITIITAEVDAKRWVDKRESPISELENKLRDMGFN